MIVGGLSVLLATSPTFAQQTVDVAALARDSRVRAALDLAQSGEADTIADQIRFCEVPAPPFKEAARGEVLRRAFVDLGLQNVRVDRAGNVLGDRPGAAARPHLVVAAHLDTVFPEDTNVKVTRQGALLKGPGIGDNCRGLGVLVAIIRSMNKAGVETPGLVTFVADVGEEGLGDLRGMKALFTETLKGQVDRFVSIDNAGIHVSVIGVGSHRYRITFKGPGGHSFADFGLPNPANALGRAVAKIADLQVPNDPRTTFNVGRIGGGTSVNAIPSEAWMEVDMRSSSPAALAALDARVQQAVDKAVGGRERAVGKNRTSHRHAGARRRPAGGEDVGERADCRDRHGRGARAQPSGGVQRVVERRQPAHEPEYSRDHDWRRRPVDQRARARRVIRLDRRVEGHAARPADYDCAGALSVPLRDAFSF